MSKRVFTDAERYALFTVHGERCYMCRRPVDLDDFDVDHVIPEVLQAESKRLECVLAELGRPADFDLQSFANLLPACKPCNNDKRDTPFEPSLLLQRALQKASAKATAVADMAKSVLSRQKITSAFAVIRMAATSGLLSDRHRAVLKDFAVEHEALRAPEAAGTPIHLTPLLRFVGESNGIRIVQGPYGQGAQPSNVVDSRELRCGNCGNIAWNGARCVACGQLADD